MDARRLTRRLIRWFVDRYDVNMAEAANPDIASYQSFNDFFTRALRDDARPFAEADYLCPVDGVISQFGAIEGDQIFQAKGHRYSTAALVGGDPAPAARSCCRHIQHRAMKCQSAPNNFHLSAKLSRRSTTY